MSILDGPNCKCGHEKHEHDVDEMIGEDGDDLGYWVHICLIHPCKCVQYEESE